MERVSAESGKSFDPQVVSILERRYKELESRAWEEAKRNPAETIAASSAPRDLGKLAARLLIEPDLREELHRRSDRFGAPGDATAARARRRRRPILALRGDRRRGA